MMQPTEPKSSRKWRDLVWSAKTQSRTGRREGVFMMQSAEDRFGTDRIRFSPPMAWIGTWKDEAAGWGIGNTGTQCDMWASAVVVGDP